MSQPTSDVIKAGVEGACAHLATGAVLAPGTRVHEALERAKAALNREGGSRADSIPPVTPPSGGTGGLEDEVRRLSGVVDRLAGIVDRMANTGGAVKTGKEKPPQPGG